MDEKRIKGIKAQERNIVSNEWSDFDPNSYSTIIALKRCVTMRLNGLAKALVKVRQEQAGLTDFDQRSDEIEEEKEIRQRWLLRYLLTGCTNRDWISEIKSEWEESWSENKKRRQAERAEALRILYPNTYYPQMRDIYQNYDATQSHPLMEISKFIHSFLGSEVNNQQFTNLIAMAANGVINRQQELFMQASSDLYDAMAQRKNRMVTV